MTLLGDEKINIKKNIVFVKMSLYINVFLCFSHFSPDKSKSSSGSGITKLSGGSGSGGGIIDDYDDDDDDDHNY